MIFRLNRYFKNKGYTTHETNQKKGRIVDGFYI